MSNSIRRYCGSDLKFSLPAGGFYLWCQLQTGVTSQVLLHEATKNGVSFVPGGAFYTEQSSLKELRLCYATHPEAKLQEGIKRLAKTLSSLTQRLEHGGLENISSTRPII